MTSFINFMEAPTGRVIRVLVGAALMLWGFGFAGGTPGWPGGWYRRHSAGGHGRVGRLSARVVPAVAEEKR